MIIIKKRIKKRTIGIPSHRGGLNFPRDELRCFGF